MSTLAPISLVIHTPTHEQSFVGTGAVTSIDVTLQGEITATAFPNPAALFRTWYSSLQGSIGHTDTVTVGLQVGSHIVTYMAKDQSEEGVPPAQLADLYKGVQHIGAAGGAPEPPPANGDPCVVHVLLANMLAPGAGVTTLSKSNAVLEAQAPVQWAKYDQYTELDPSYHAVNKLRYRWLFQRLSPPQPVIELEVQGGKALRLIAPSDTVAPPPRLRFTGALPATLTIGATYAVTLRVEHQDNSALGHQIARVVTLGA